MMFNLELDVKVLLKPKFCVHLPFFKRFDVWCECVWRSNFHGKCALSRSHSSAIRRYQKLFFDITKTRRAKENFQTWIIFFRSGFSFSKVFANFLTLESTSRCGVVVHMQFNNKLAHSSMQHMLIYSARIIVLPQNSQQWLVEFKNSLCWHIHITLKLCSRHLNKSNENQKKKSQIIKKISSVYFVCLFFGL